MVLELAGGDHLDGQDPIIAGAGAGIGAVFHSGLMRSRRWVMQETGRRSIGTIFVSEAKIMHKGASDAVYARCSSASNHPLAC